MFTDYTKGMITEYFVRGAVSHIYRGDRGYPLTIHYRNGRKIVHRSIPCFVVYCRMSFDGKLLYVGNENCVLHCFDSETLDPLDPRLLGMFDNEGAVVNKENFNIFKGLMLTEYEFKAGDYCTQCNSANDVRYSNFDGSILICQKCFNDFYRMMYFRIIDMLADESLAEKRRVKMTSEYTRTECKKEGIHHISAYIKVETSDDYLTHNHPDNYLKSLCYQDKCPFCGIDAILPETCGQKLDEDFLIKMKEYWFESDKLIQINSKLQTYETYYSFILLDTDSLNIILNGIQCYLDGKYILCMNKSDVIQEISGRYTVMNLSFSPFVLNLNINKENNINACDLYLFSQRNEKYKGIISLNNDEYDTIILYFKRIERFMDHKEYLWVCKVSKDMSSILNVAECAFSNRRAPEGNEIIRYIKDHIRDNLTLTKLCEQFHMSRTTLAKIIYDLTGTSPMSYVLEERLTQVLPELVFTDIPVNVLAEKYGFSGDNYFIRCSRKRYGKSPLQYRLERRN